MAFPKNTASRNSDGWHLCRQDFIQLLWLSQSKNANQHMSSPLDANRTAQPLAQKPGRCHLVCLFALISSYNITCTTLMNASSEPSKHFGRTNKTEQKICRNKIKLGPRNIPLNITNLPHDKHTKTSKQKNSVQFYFAI